MENLATRPWRPDDLEALRASESLFASPTYPQRFLSGRRRLRPFHARISAQLVAPGQRWTGQVAVQGDRIAALAECLWDPADADSATLTVNVADAWQAGGLGRRTLRDLVSRCLDMGLTTFTMDYAASNITVTAMLRAVGAEAGERWSLSGVTPAGLGHLTVRALRRPDAPLPG